MIAMSKKAFIAAIAVSIAFSFLFLAVNIKEDLALDAPPSLLIISPENKTYSTNALILDIQVEAKSDPQTYLETTRQVTYSLNGSPNLPTEERYHNFFYYDETNQSSLDKYAASLTNLPDGPNNITVFVEYTTSYGVAASNATIFFTIDTNPPPSPTPTIGTTPPPSPSPTLAPIESPTQQPTSTPTQPTTPICILVGVNPLPLIMGIITVIILTVVVVLVYFKKRKGRL
jgi:hypothetical protein